MNNALWALRPCCGEYPHHAGNCWTMQPQNLTWYTGWWGRWRHSPFPTRRCRAVTDDHPQYSGRCELTAHAMAIDHAVRRHGWVLRWSTEWTSQRVVDEPLQRV